MGKIHLGNGIRKGAGWVYNPGMKRWVRRKKKGRGFEVSAYHRGAKA